MCVGGGGGQVAFDWTVLSLCIWKVPMDLLLSPNSVSVVVASDWTVVSLWIWKVPI